MKIIFTVLLIAGIYTFYLVFFTNQIKVAANTRELFTFQLERVTLGIEGISFSVIAAFMGTLAILCFTTIKKPLIKYISSASFLILSISLGKITIILSILLSLLLFFLTKLFKNKIRIIVYGLFLMISFSFYTIPKIILPFIDVTVIQADLFFNNRISLWLNFVENITKLNIIDIIFGNGFFNQGMLSDFILFHPHNQYLGVLYISGILGFISYVLFWWDILRTALKKCILSNNYNPLLILFFIIFIQIGDDYIFFTMEPFYIFLTLHIYITSKKYLIASKKLEDS